MRGGLAIDRIIPFQMHRIKPDPTTIFKMNGLRETKGDVVTKITFRRIAVQYRFLSY